jgi:SHOCT-like domain
MNREEILKMVASGELGVDEASKLLAEVEPPRRGTLYCKVSPKGAVSLYGLQRMPVTLYVEQWERLLDYSDELRKFLVEHNSELKRKERK